LLLGRSATAPSVCRIVQGACSRAPARAAVSVGAVRVRVK